MIDAAECEDLEGGVELGATSQKLHEADLTVADNCEFFEMEATGEFCDLKVASSSFDSLEVEGE